MAHVNRVMLSPAPCSQKSRSNRAVPSATVSSGSQALRVVGMAAVADMDQELGLGINRSMASRCALKAFAPVTVDL